MKTTPAKSPNKTRKPTGLAKMKAPSEALTDSDQKLADEIFRRRAAEASLEEVERNQVRLLREAKSSQIQMRNLSRRLLKAQEQERHRISRELHDDVLQTLVGINVQLEALRRDAHADSSQLATKIAKTQRIVAESVSAVHRFARELRPMILDDLGLLPAVRSQLDEFRKRTKISVRLTAVSEVEDLDDDRRTAIYRVIQASLSNVAHHSAAVRATVGIRTAGNLIVVRIHDAGKSFDVAHTLHVGNYKRLGLLGMRERVEMVGGTFSVTSSPARGTTVKAEFPRTRRRSKKAVLPR